MRICWNLSGQKQNVLCSYSCLMSLSKHSRKSWSRSAESLKQSYCPRLLPITWKTSTSLPFCIDCVLQWCLSTFYWSQRASRQTQSWTVLPTYWSEWETSLSPAPIQKSVDGVPKKLKRGRGKMQSVLISQCSSTIGSTPEYLAICLLSRMSKAFCLKIEVRS